MRLVVAVLLAAGLLVVGSPAAAAEPGLPPKLDVDAAIAALESQQIYRAPGAVAWFDEDLVRAELAPHIRILLAPYTGRFEKGNNYADGDEHYEQVYEPLSTWAEERGVTLIRVEGLYVASSTGSAARPSTIAELRQVIVYSDVTELLVGLVREAKNAPEERQFDVDHQPNPVVEPTRAQVDELAGKLRANRIYNAPGLTADQPVPDGLIEYAREEFGLDVRVAAFSGLRRGTPFVDYAPALAKRFPKDVIMVSHGGWLEVAAPEQQEITSARDYAYGRYQVSTFEHGVIITDRMITVLERYHRLVQGTAFARPLPEPFDPARQVAAVTPWLLLGSAVVLAGGSLLPWWVRRRRRSGDQQAALRLAGARTFADLAGFAADLLAARNSGAELSTAWERHATARRLYEQAHTAEAMAEVRRICAQGRKLLDSVRSGRVRGRR